MFFNPNSTTNEHFCVIMITLERFPHAKKYIFLNKTIKTFNVSRTLNVLPKTFQSKNASVRKKKKNIEFLLFNMFV